MTDYRQFIFLFVKRNTQLLRLLAKKSYQLISLPIKKYFTFNIFHLISLNLLILLLLISYFWPRDNFIISQLASIRWPYSIKKRLNLTKAFFAVGDLEKAKLEVKQANSLYQLFKFIDWQGNLKQQLIVTNDLINQPEKIKKQINYWETVLINRPNFRDVYLKLSLLYYQLWEVDKARENWNKAFYLDPNNEVVQKIGKELSFCNSALQCAIAD